ncbi:PKD domain-containing protein [Kitasatospora sp. NBC_00315]|uniref:PKD domain-containing protein n=1 Tax=Kitasatospora sp. NBC_00315 TaxID=2975963 RepID=UPI0032484C7F
MPTLAFAADAPSAAATKRVDAGLDPVTSGSSNFTTFSSPAKKSVQSRVAAAPAAAAPAAGAAAAPAAQSANPTLAVALNGQYTSAYGLSLDTIVTSDAVALTTVISWGDGTTSTVNSFGAGTSTTAHTYAQLGPYQISVTVSDASGNKAANTASVTTAGSDYTAFGPTRLLDTRDGTGAAKAPVQPYTGTRLKVGGSNGIPSGVTAVAINVTVTNAAAGGHITVYGEGDTKPTTSNVNFSAGQTVPNMVIVPVGSNGYIDLYNDGWGTVDLIGDVAGYFTRSASSGYTSLASTRLVDTRNGTGTTQGQVAPGTSFPVQIAGAAGGQLPAGVTAVALNVTVTNPRSAGYLTVYPSGQNAPSASNVNFSEGQTIANSVIAPVGSDGKIRVKNGAWTAADVIVDVVGYYSTASHSAYLPVVPERVIDSRTAADGPSIPGGYYYPVVMFPDAADVTGYVFNATVTNTAGTGFLATTPDPNTLDTYKNGTPVWPTRAPGSTLNWLRGQTVPNLVQATGGSTGIVDFWNISDGDADLVVDWFGFYQND